MADSARTDASGAAASLLAAVAAGDLDGDGLDEAIAGAAGWDEVAEDAGAVLAFRGFPTDGDADGHVTPLDCDDADPAVHPAGTVACGNGIDEDCDGADIGSPPAGPDGG